MFSNVDTVLNLLLFLFFREGVLTKAPTDALREIASARLVDPSKDCYTGGIGQFLLAGVQPPRDGEEGKVIIPTKHKTDSRETSAKTKVSNKCKKDNWVGYRDSPRQGSGSHFDSQTPDYWQNDTQLYFAGFPVFVDSKEIFQQLNL